MDSIFHLASQRDPGKKVCLQHCRFPHWRPSPSLVSETYLPFWVRFPGQPKQRCSLPFMGCKWRRGAVENQKYKYPHPSGCFEGILIPVWKGPSAARAALAVTGRARWAQAAPGCAPGQDELFWALRLQGCAEPLPWGAKSRLGVGTTPLPSRPPRHWAGGLKPKASLPWEPGVQGKPQHSWGATVLPAVHGRPRVGWQRGLIQRHSWGSRARW